jgi:hypothetical protein
MRAKLKDAIIPGTLLAGTALGYYLRGDGGLKDKIEEEAKKEFDPVETTLDGAEEYILDPLGNITPTQAAIATGVGLGGLGIYKAYQAYNDMGKPS